MRKVPFFDYSRIFRDHEHEYLEIIKAVGQKGAYIMQSELAEFEKAAAAFIGAKYAVGVGNATDGLEMIWQSIGLKAGDEVIVSAHTMVATASAIKTAGGTPVPVDIEDTGLISPDSIRKNITNKTVAICPTQLNGHICEMNAILEIAREFNLILVEDAAQAYGAYSSDGYAGLFGIAGAFSFYPAKNLGALGDAGLVVTNDETLYKKLLALRDHGRNENGEIVSWGRNSRLDNLQAAILQSQLNRYKETIAHRQEIALAYDQVLKKVPQVSITHSNLGDQVSVFQNYEILAENRQELLSYLKNNNIGYLIPWGGQQINKLNKLGIDFKLSKVDDYFKKCVMLPLNLSISKEDANYVAIIISDFYGASN